MSYVDKVIGALVANDARTATKYITDRRVVRATRRMWGGKILNRTYNMEITLTIGRPNYRERQFIKQCKRAGEPFPVKKIQLRFPANKRV